MSGEDGPQAVDPQDALDAVEALVPGAVALARGNRIWLERVCRFLVAEARVTQFLDLGAGLPIAGNTHQVVRRLSQTAQVIYVDNDPATVSHGQSLVADDARVWFVEGDLSDPDTVLADPVIRRHLDFTQPMALLQSATLHHLPDELVDGVMARYIAALAPGSYVALSHLCDPGGEAGEQVRRARGSLLGEHFRPRAAIEALLAGLELLPSSQTSAEGLVPVGQWWPDGPFVQLSELEHCLLGAVGRKN